MAGGAALIFTAGISTVSIVAPGAVAGVAGAAGAATAGAGASMLPIALGIFGIGNITS